MASFFGLILFITQFPIRKLLLFPSSFRKPELIKALIEKLALYLNSWLFVSRIFLKKCKNTYCGFFFWYSYSSISLLSRCVKSIWRLQIESLFTNFFSRQYESGQKYLFFTSFFLVLCYMASMFWNYKAYPVKALTCDTIWSEQLLFSIYTWNSIAFILASFVYICLQLQNTYIPYKIEDTEICTDWKFSLFCLRRLSVRCILTPFWLCARGKNESILFLGIGFGRRWKITLE